MYDVILADPPWQYQVFAKLHGKAGKAKGVAEAHYPTMRLSDIAALPVAHIANPNAALFLWATSPCLPEAFAVMKAWGFAYKTVGFAWVKVYSSGRPYCGLGHYTRSGVEVCLLGLRGRLARMDNKVLQVMTAPVQGHSHKPAQQYPLIERLFGAAAKRVELFARQHRPGWDVWGDQLVSTPAVAAVLQRPEEARA